MISDFWEELKQIIIEKIKFIYAKGKYLLLVFLFIICLLSIKLFNIVEPEIIESQTIYIWGISISNWLEWTTIITIPFTACWAVYQYNKNLSSKKQEKAVEIGKEFSKNIIDKCGIINSVYKISSLKNFLEFDEKNYDDFKFFTVDELRKIYNNDDFPTQYIAAREKAVQELDDIYHLVLLQGITSFENLSQSETDTSIENKEKEESKDKENINAIKQKLKTNPFILQNKNFPYHFFDLESEALNQLEYICMDISSKATDSKFIYQSLHQMFLRTVRTLAIEISVHNYNFSDKYYTNIIHVYNDWTSRYIKDLKIERRKKEKINKILNPKIKTV